MVRVERTSLTSIGERLYIAWKEAEGMTLTKQELIQLRQAIDLLLKWEE